MIFLERWEMNLAGKDILQFPIPDNDILAIIENLKLKPFVKAQSLALFSRSSSVIGLYSHVFHHCMRRETWRDDGQ